MSTLVMLVVGVAVLPGCPPRSTEDALSAYSRAFDTAFRRQGTVELSDTQGRLKGLGDSGKPFQPELDDMRRRQGEVNDLLVKAVELKKQALIVKNPSVASVEEATQILNGADAKAQSLGADLKRLNERLTAAGAPQVKPIERDPNARD